MFSPFIMLSPHALSTGFQTKCSKHVDLEAQNKLSSAPFLCKYLLAHSLLEFLSESTCFSDLAVVIKLLSKLFRIFLVFSALVIAPPP
jgi:hypothetical protein